MLGWRKNTTQPIPEKCIICLAPHTSNWDFLLGQAYARAEGLNIGFLMKKEWFFWPLGPIFKHMGGIPVYRKKHTHMSDTIAETAKKANTFRLCITPEGTRKKTTEWKRGFYYIALKAQMPILLYAADYKEKTIECTRTIMPDGNIEQQMKEIKQYYEGKQGKHPENFSTGSHTP